MTLTQLSAPWIVALFAVVSPLAPQTGEVGIVQGTVYRAGTSEPLADVRITVALPAGTVPAGSPPALTAVSDVAGRFVVRNVPVGNVIVRSQIAGYFGAPVNGVNPTVASTTVTVVAGRTSDVRLAMIPGGTISGRVVDSSGRPLPDILVHALLLTYPNGVPLPVPVNSRTTDDRGEYRIFAVAPGQYYVEAVPQPPQGPGASSPDSTRESPIRTLYPNAADLIASIPVVVVSGEEKSGIDIQMKRAVYATVSGRVTSTLPPGPVVRTTTTAVDVAGTVRPSIAELGIISRADRANDIALVVNAKEDNSFELRNIPPGLYELVARLPATAGWGEVNPPPFALNPFALGRTSIEVRDGNVENVSIVVQQGLDLTGVITVDGRPTPAALRLSLRADDVATRTGIHGSLLAQVAAYQPRIGSDGSFTIPMVPAARYRFQVVLNAAPQLLSQTVRPSQEATSVRTEQTGLTSLPPTAYVSDIRQSGESVYDNGLNVGVTSLAPMEVIVNTDSGSLEGTVLNSQQKPVVDAIVVLVPPANRRQNPALYKTTRSDNQGHFVLTTIPPGSYKVFAWDSVQPGAYQDPSFIGGVEGRGSVVTIPASARASVNVALIE